MAFSSEWQFIFAVFMMYGFLFMMYTYSNGAAFGLPSTSALAPTAPATGGITDFLVGSLLTVKNFFALLFLTPLSGLWYLTFINWAIMGTTIYLFIRILRGGG